MSTRPRQTRRTFSTEFKKQMVYEIENKVTTVRHIMQTYEVAERTIYTWLHKFGVKWQPKTNVVVQLESEAVKRKHLQEQIRHLEATIGQKQVEIDILEQILSLVEQDYGISLKKNTSGDFSITFTKTGNSLPIPFGLCSKLLGLLNRDMPNTKSDVQPNKSSLRP